MNKRFLLAPLVLLTLTLSACAPLLFGAATTGGMVAASNRTAGAFVEDERIELKAFSNLLEDVGGDVRFSVVSFNRVLLLVGQAPNEQLRERVVSIVEQIENVRQVINKMKIGAQIDFKSQLSDTVTTTQVKGKFIKVQEGEFNALNFKVLTEDGIVYLMGLVTRKNAATAVELARQVQGVRQVIKVFEYLPAADKQS